MTYCKMFISSPIKINVFTILYNTGQNKENYQKIRWYHTDRFIHKFYNKKSFYQDNYVEDDDDGDYETEKEVYDDGEEDYGSEADDDVPSLDGGFSFSGEETKSKFTSYSMSSSVIRRNNQVCFLFCPCNCHHSMFMG